MECLTGKRIYMRVVAGLLASFFAGAMLSCSHEQEVKQYSVSYLFKDSASGWTGDFADYPVDTTGYHLHAGLDTLPYNINTDSTKKAIRLSGFNSSDDLFMFVKRKVSGLRKNTTYQLLFNVRLASNAKTNATGVGGAPGESVYLKVGGSTDEPVVENIGGYYMLNIDKGAQGSGGENMIVIGNIGVTDNTTTYTIITRFNNATTNLQVTTNDAGELWLIVGTDSGFEGETTLYYTQVDVLFNKAED